MMNSNLKQHLRLFIVIFILSNYTFGQRNTISGSIYNSHGDPMPFVKISVLNFPDSLYISGSISDELGNFSVALKDTGHYWMLFSFTGFERTYTQVYATNQTIDLGAIILTTDSKLLDSINVETTSISSIQDGDTTLYNANAYKVNPDANAQDLVTKIPGVTLIDGKLETQGEQVTEVLVDGKPFFGSDPNSVLKNVPAEMIDQVQIYDRKSDQAMASGIDDGTTTKTINIITKVDYKNGTFGRAYGGYGNEDRFQGGFSVNNFSGNRRISIIGMANNVNQQNFSSDDLSGIFNSGGRGSNEFSGYMNTSNFYVSQRNGLSSTYATGINYVNEWKKITMTSSYFFNLTSNETIKNLNRIYISDAVIENSYSEKETSLSNTYSHLITSKIEIKLDSANSISFKPTINLQQHTGSSDLLGKNYNGVLLTNDITTLFSTKFSSVYISAPITFKHKFAKKKRSFSFFADAQYTINNGNNSLFSSTYIDAFISDSLDQIANLKQNGYYLNTEISYTEPFRENALLVFSVEQDFSKSFAEKITNSMNSFGEYTLTDSTLSNAYNLNYMAIRPTIAYKYQWPKSTLSLNASVQYSELFGSQNFPFESEIRKPFFNFLPSIQFSYRPERKKNLRINYTTKTQNPEVNELQSVVDNTNPIQLRSGNPNLVQEYFQTLSFRYSKTNSTNNSNFQFSLSASHADNYIATNSILAATDTIINGTPLNQGMQYNYPVNLDGYLSARTFISFGYQIKKIKSNVNTTAGINYSTRPSMINDQLNKTGSTSFRFTVGLSSNISEKIDFNVSTTSSYTLQNNTIRPEANTTYFNQRSQLKLVYSFWKGFVFETDAIHHYYDGLNETVSNNFITSNASFGYKFFKKKNGHLRLTAFDIFNQNSNVTRTITDIYFEDVQSNTINRYFMLEFIYKFNYFKNE